MVYNQFKERPNSLNNLKRYLVSRRNVPGLNLGVCLKYFFNIIVESQSAGNLFDFNYLRILREYTPDIVCSNKIL